MSKKEVKKDNKKLIVFVVFILIISVNKHLLCVKREFNLTLFLYLCYNIFRW